MTCRRTCARRRLAEPGRHQSRVIDQKSQLARQQKGSARSDQQALPEALSAPQDRGQRAAQSIPRNWISLASGTAKSAATWPKDE
jgi:hypothetical protein